MRDLRKDGAECEASVELAYSTIATQRRIIASMYDDDPALPMAKRLLEAMQGTASIAELNRAMALYDAEGVAR